MKKGKLRWFVLTGVMGTSAALWAATPIILDGPPPQQMYQSLTQANTESTPISSAQNAVTTNKSNLPTSPDNSSTIAQQITQLNQSALHYQAESEQRLADLTNRHSALAAQLQTLTQMMQELSQEVTQLRAAQSQLNAASGLNSTLPHVNESITKQWSNWFQGANLQEYATVLGAVIVLIGVGFLVGRWNRNKAHAANRSEIISNNNKTHDTEGEYDFMETNEAIPALLDLARSYLAMDNQGQAMTALRKVIERGNLSQQKEASELINKIAAKT